MAIGQGLFVAGDLLWNWYEVIGEDPFPSMADVLYLAGYPFIAAGLLLLIRRRVGDGDRGGLLDAAILTTAAAILSWTFLIQPQLVNSDLDALSLAITLAYPVADLILIGVAMGLLTTPGARTASFRLLGASLALLLVADQIYAIQNLDGTYVSGGPLDSLYLVSYLLFGAAAPASLDAPADRAASGRGHLARVRSGWPDSPSRWSPARSSSRSARTPTATLAVIAAGTAILSLLVLARLAGLVGTLARDVAQRRALEAQLSFQAFHDPLTGLTNRRRFVEAAEAALASRTGPGSVAVLFLDLDDFKTVNDSLGHAAGDALLDRRRGPAPRRPPRDRRRGPDRRRRVRHPPDRDPRPEFAVTVAERLLARLIEPIDVAGVTVEVGASVGIAVDAPSMRTVDDLLGDADVAMYQAKALGKGRHHVFDAASTEDRADRARAWVERGPTVRRTVHDRRRSASRGWSPGRARLRGGDGDPALPAPHGPLPRHRPAAPHLRGPLPRADAPLPRHRRAVRRRPHPRGRRGRGARRPLALAGVGALVEIREAGRYPDGRYDLLAAATGRFAIRRVDPGREPYLVADVTPLEDEVGDEARAERLSASAIRRFVRYLELMRARDGETSEVLDIRVEVDSPAASETDAAPR